MRIALDYDGTYTADPLLWERFIDSARSRGHEVLVVTMRRPDEAISIPGCSVVYTSRKAKVAYMADRPGKIDIWIDDSPHWLLEDSI